MTEKQYEDMTIISQFCRIFADQIRKCMENTGLLNEGFYLELSVRPSAVEARRDYSTVCIAKNLNEVGVDEWKATRMEQWKYDNEDWEVFYDPFAKSGTLPKEICYAERRSFEETLGEENCGAEGTKPFPPDGLWVSDRDNTCDVDGGM